MSGLRARPPRALLCEQIGFADLEKNTPPEMQRTNLAAIVLQLKARSRQRTPCNRQHATDNWHRANNRRHATDNGPHATDKTTCNARRAARSTRLHAALPTLEYSRTHPWLPRATPGPRRCLLYVGDGDRRRAALRLHVAAARRVDGRSARAPVRRSTQRGLMQRGLMQRCRR